MEGLRKVLHEAWTDFHRKDPLDSKERFDLFGFLEHRIEGYLHEQRRDLPFAGGAHQRIDAVSGQIHHLTAEVGKLNRKLDKRLDEDVAHLMRKTASLTNAGKSLAERVGAVEDLANHVNERVNAAWTRLEEVSKWDQEVAERLDRLEALFKGQEPVGVEGDELVAEYDEPSEEERARWCCFLGCGRDAEFEIYGSSGHPEDTTDACEDHVGAVIGTPIWLPKHNDSWTVVPIQEGAAEEQGATKLRNQR